MAEKVTVKFSCKKCGAQFEVKMSADEISPDVKMPKEEEILPSVDKCPYCSDN